MLNLISGSLPLALEVTQHDARIGFLLTPFNGNLVEHSVNARRAWGMDNGCFLRYDPPAILRTLRRMQGQPGCLFAAVPDWFDREYMRGDHELTLLLFRAWIGTYEMFNLPPALVIQDGCTLDSIPFASIASVFIGGSDDWKLGPDVRRIVAKARALGKWVHMGRVNGKNRILYARSIGVQSTDGSGYARFMRDRLPRDIHYFRQNPLWELMETDYE